MTIVPPAWVEAEVSSRVAPFKTKHEADPLVRRIDYRIGVDWSDDPAVFITITLASKETPTPELLQIAESLRADLRRLVHTDDIGLHSYLNFVSDAGS